jgi:hypothetical protein
MEAARATFGGRGRSARGVGEVVSFARDDATVTAVVLFVEELERDLCEPDGTLTRRRADECAPAVDVTDPAIVQLAAEARAFALVDELERVRFRVGATVDHGMIAEKCRFGALVMRDDGSLEGVSFRDINPS